MICSDCVILGDVRIHPEAVVHPKVNLVADEGKSVTVGQQSIVEEMCVLRNASLGSSCLVEVGSNLFEV
jgi:carbonic anhydrase/acetyltransferase-like protein (isoleucine patch superfamily)